MEQNTQNCHHNRDNDSNNNGNNLKLKKYGNKNSSKETDKTYISR